MSLIPHDSRTDPALSPWPEKIAATPRLREPKLSPDGSSVLYQVAPFYNDGRTYSELWLAKTDVPQSARPITNGLFNDRGGVFHPDGNRIFFLSDRHNPGGRAAHIYTLELDSNVGAELFEPAPLTPSFARKGIQSFQISPDGSLVAFTSSGDDGPPKNYREDGDVRLFGMGTSGFSQLQVYDLGTGVVSTLEGIRKDRQIESYTWCPDSKRILYRLRQGHGLGFAFMDVTLESIEAKEDAPPCVLGTYPSSPYGSNIWTSSGNILSLQHFDPNNKLDARTLFSQYVDDAFSPHAKLKGWEKLYGETEDAIKIVDMTPGAAPNEGDLIALEVSSNVDTRIDVVSTGSDGSLKTLFTLFETNQDALWFGAWDSKRIIDSDGNITYVFVGVLSSGIRHEPPNLWAGKVKGKMQDISSQIRLSSHLQWMLDVPVIKTEVVHWEAADGTSLNGLIRYPPSYDASWGPQPTVMFLHGGPYIRDVPNYMFYYNNWREHFALAGYIVISPNYRGSQGRGHDFAHAASRGIGVYDWQDCESMVDLAIKRGLADPDRLGVAGWSHGGSLAAWGVTKTKNRFKAAIIGGGASNWEGMVMDSLSPDLEAAIGGSAPWDHEQLTRKMSPIHSVADVETAVLLLHGEKDERMSVGQAVGMWRGLKKRGSERGKRAAELAIYPRERHAFVERKHAEDVLKRVLIYFFTWI